MRKRAKECVRSLSFSAKEIFRKLSLVTAEQAEIVSLS